MSSVSEVIQDFINSKPIGSLQLKYLVYLKKWKAFVPKVVYDIGATTTKWSEIICTLYPDSELILFDASNEFEELYKNKKYFINCLSNIDDKEVEFYLPLHDDYRVKSYYKPIRCDTHSNTIKTIKLDTLVEKNNLPEPDLVKISCCGSEKDIIEGALKTFKNTKYLIVQLQNEELFEGAPLADTVGPYIESLGFERIESLDSYGTPLIDYVFENKNI
jgi:FkbM family methyltransferase